MTLLQKAVSIIPRHDARAVTQILTADGYIKWATGKKLATKDFKPQIIAKLKKYADRPDWRSLI